MADPGKKNSTSPNVAAPTGKNPDNPAAAALCCLFVPLAILRKIIFYAVIAATAALIALIVFFDTILYFAISAAGSKIIGLPVTVEEVETSFHRGDIKLINLKIGSAAEPVIQVDSIYVDIDKTALFSGNPVIRKLELRNTSLYGNIYDDNQPDIRRTADRIFSIFSAGSGKTGGLTVEDIIIDNFRIIFRDRRKEHHIDGFGLYLQKFAGNCHDGKFSLSRMRIVPPRGYEKNMLEILSADAEFLPDTSASLQPIVKQLEVNGMHAVAGLHEKTSSIQDVLETFSAIFQSRFETAEHLTAIPVFQKIIINNSSFTFWDSSRSGLLHGFGIRVKELDCSPANGTFTLAHLQISNPRGDNRKFLEIRQASAGFEPDSIFSKELVINDIYADGIRVAAELNKNDDSDVHELLDSMEDIFFPSDGAATEPITAGDDKIYSVKIDKFDLRNGLLALSDTRNPGQENKFTAGFKQLSGSWESGQTFLKNFTVSDLRTPGEEIVSIKSAEMKFVPESLAAPVTVIENIELAGLYAAARLYGNNQSDISGITNALQILLSPVFSGSIRDAASPDKQQAAGIRVNRFRISDSMFLLKDQRELNNVHGVSLSLGNFEFTRQEGMLLLNNIKISNPHTFSKPEMLNLAYLSAKFTFRENSKNVSQIDAIDIDGLHVNVEFNRDGKCNIHESCDALCLLFSGGTFVCRVSPGTDEPADRQEEQADSEPSSVIKLFKLDNSTLSIWDARQKVPMEIPLKQQAADIELSSSNQSTLDSMHMAAVDLEKECSGATDPSKLLLDILDSTARSGMQLIQSSVLGNGKILQHIFNTFQ